MAQSADNRVKARKAAAPKPAPTPGKITLH
jgi:hypothetical protein